MSKLSFLISSGELYGARRASQSWSSLAALRPVLMVSGLALGASAALAGPGVVDAVSHTGAAVRLPTYFANSPSGTSAAGSNTGTAIRKFVDPLPLVGADKAQTLSADAAAIKYLPKAVATKWVNPMGVATTDDYVELAVVEYQEKFHSDLAAKTTLRGFVQIDVEASNGRSSNIAGSKQIALVDAQGNALTILATDANGKLVKDASGKFVKVAAKAVDEPHYLGPVVNATTGVPMRVKLHNLLPVGRAVLDANGNVAQRKGDHFLPFDTTVSGAGIGPDGQTRYTQNRVTLHVQGIDAPWISAGSPHQWFTPAGESDASIAGSLAAEFAADATRDPAYLAEYLRGASAVAVPDMNEPGPGAMTYYFANQQGARMLWANDKTVGQGRLNTYGGMVLPYIVSDAAEQKMVSDGLLPPAARTLPLILQDRSFVPRDIALQDAKWNTTAWGGESSLWFPHVYEPLSDPQFKDNWNPVGRWLYGPTFWPVFPAYYNLPDGSYPNPSFTPEAFFDTAVVNGVAYPTTEVEPTTYRLRIVNASNDRWMTFNLFEGKVTAQLADGTPVTNPFGIASEVDMMQATAPNPADACADGQARPTQDPTTGKWCVPTTWPFDSRVGGVAAPSGVGPSLFQFANEAGLIAKVAEIAPTPLFYVMDKGRITVLNPETPALFMAPGDVADVVVDFSQYAGKSLLAYNDAGGPEPGADPRNFYYTGVGDQSTAGGAEDTKPGYGPNVRTLMQFKVKPTMNDGSAAPAAWTPDALNTAVSAAYIDPVAGQDKPVVAQPDYAAFNAAWSGITLGPATAPGTATAYADIYTSTLKNPYFEYVPGTPAAFNSISVTTRGSGYITAPTVTLTGGGGTGAKATASLKIKNIKILDPGSGYTSAPTADIGVPTVGLGSGALIDARLAPNKVTLTAGGTGYSQAAVDAAIAAGTFARFSTQPGATAPTVASATVSATGAITAVTLNPGAGYTVAPTMTITVAGGTGARGTVTAGIGSVTLIPAYPVSPDSAGGGGYTDLSAVTARFGGGGANAVPPTVEITGEVFEVSITDMGTGYTSAPTVSIAAPGTTPSGTVGVRALAQVDTLAGGAAKGKILAKAKSIQELFEPSFGRYNSTQGVELPYTTAYTQTTIPLGYVDTPTEFITQGDTQVWKYVHNGLFCQPVEFSGFNVQVVNRVGWDGFVVPPQPNEIGWKSVLRVNPLEDAIIALRPKKTKLPGFALPGSYRLMDPTQPWGSPYGFTQFDPTTGLAAPVVNDYVDYGQESATGNTMGSRAAVDFHRPVVFNGKDLAPAAATAVTAQANAVRNGVTGTLVTWTDATPPAAGDSTKAEVGFRVQIGRSGSTAYSDVAGDLRGVVGAGGAIRTVHTPANVTELFVPAGQADNLPPVSAPNAPTLPFFGGAPTATSVSIAWTLPTGAAASAGTITGFRVLRAQVAADGVALGAFQDLGVQLAANARNYTDNTVQPGTAYVYEVQSLGTNTASVTYRVVAVNAVGETSSAASSAVNATGTAQPATSQPSGIIATVLPQPVLPGESVTLSKTGTLFLTRYYAAFNFNAVTGAQSYVVQYRVGNSANNGNWATYNGALTSNGGLLSTAPLQVGNNQYVTFRVYAVSANQVVPLNGTAAQAIVSATTTSATVREAIPATPSAVTVSAATTTSFTLGWTGTAGASYRVQVAADAAFANVLQDVAGVTNASLPVSGLSANTRYYVRVMASNGLGSNNAWSTAANGWTLALPVAAAPTVANVTTTGLTLNWIAPTGPGAPTSYAVQRANNAGFFGAVTTPAAGTSLDVTGLTANTSYYFRVVALNGGNAQSTPSPVLTQLTLPVAPTGVAARVGNTGGALTGGLNWTAANGLTYEIQWSTSAAMASPTLVSPATRATNATTGQITVPSTPVYMQVRAKNAAGVSDWSAVITVAAQ